jgi:hypothetical protein
MRQPTLSGIVQRRFIQCANKPGSTIQQVLDQIQIPPADLCRLITEQNPTQLPLVVYHQIAQWLQMPLANVVSLSNKRLKLEELIQLGMIVRGYRPTSAQDQIQAAAEVGISVAVFRRALHGYADFTPSIRTCDQLARWLAWTGLEPDDIVMAAGMITRYRADGTRLALSPSVNNEIKPYPCGCGRAGCMIPAHIPSGPRRKWRSDACRMWAKRQQAAKGPKLPQHDPITRFITINERSVPVRF